MANPIFIGLGTSAPCWYRCVLPASTLGYDWAGTSKRMDMLNSFIGGSQQENPNLDDYDVVIIQQPTDVDLIKHLQKQGKKVIYEIDDFIHGVHKIKYHPNRQAFAKRFVRMYQACMVQADAMICSTEFLSNQYKKYNPNQYICKVGIDTKRYARIERPEREDKIVIGWSGGTGHHNALQPWLEEIAKILKIYSNVQFISFGAEFGRLLGEIYPGQATSIPWVSIENYPYALTNFDIAIAPAHDSKYFKSKSDLRWLESSAIGTPVVAHPSIYPDVIDDKTGMLAQTPAEAGDAIMELIESKELRTKIGSQAKEWVKEHRDIKTMASSWQSAVDDICQS